MIERDLYWQENKATLRSLVTKTIKTFDLESAEPYQLLELSKNMEEDIEFFQVIFDETIKKDKEMDQTIARRTKNWDLTRVDSIDRIILKMALTEMITFPSIPVKVTINEYIEISKIYSTPKSKQFINGILDVISNELTSEGVIRKSGRGLIDNK
jgi:N utilization substance protein B